MMNRRGGWLLAMVGCLTLPAAADVRLNPNPKDEAIKKVDEGLNSKNPDERVKAAEEAAKTWEGKK